jgi:hypothetical protein
MNMLTLIYIPGHSILTADRIDIYELKEWINNGFLPAKREVTEGSGLFNGRKCRPCRAYPRRWSTSQHFAVRCFSFQQSTKYKKPSMEDFLTFVV